MTNELTVRLHGATAARLIRHGPLAYELRYETEWNASGAAVPVSLSLPLAPGRHRGRTVADFLDNLLPDNATVRDRWAADAGLRDAEPFLLLGAYGRDVAGALEFVRADDDAQTRALTLVSDRDIGRRIRVLRADAAAWLQAEGDVGRFSLGGAQAKFTLAQHDGEWYEPAGAAPATHIFKPLVDRLPHGEVVEYLVMRVAAALGLPAAPVRLARFGGERTLIVERFDRERRPGGQIERLHQEDLLQALGRPRLQKYEADGGPGYRPVLALLDDAPLADAIASKEQFVHGLALAWVLLDTDAHAKNSAVLLEPGSHRLAPLYDRFSLLPYLAGGGSRRALEGAMDDARLSMSMLGSFRAGDVRAETWRTVARDARIDPDELLLWIHGLCEHLADVVQEEIRALPDADRSDITERFTRRVRIRTTAATRALER